MSKLLRANSKLLQTVSSFEQTIAAYAQYLTTAFAFLNREIRKLWTKKKRNSVATQVRERSFAFKIRFVKKKTIKKKEMMNKRKIYRDERR